MNLEVEEIQEVNAQVEALPEGPDVNAELEEIQEQLAAAPDLLPSGIQNPVVVVDGKPELILPNDHTYFTECAEQCFQELATQRGSFGKVAFSSS
jgi:hypothetical protein